MSDPFPTPHPPERSAGWYPDPWVPAAWRWWDGRSWTPHTSVPPQASTGTLEARPEVRESEVQLPAAEESAPRGLRRRQLIELLIVLAIFPLPYVISAAVSLATSIADPHKTQDRIPVVVSGHPGLSLPFVVALELVQLAGAALVLYLLWISGEGLSSIGLSRGEGELRRDLSYVLPVFLVAYAASILVVQALLHAAHVHEFAPLNQKLPASYALAAVAAAVVAGVVEEIVVLGYLVHRLECLGVRTVPLVLIAVAVRVSYHIYYGPGVVWVAVWALASVLLYRAIRRLLPFIIVHACWDLGLGLAAFFGVRVLAWEAIVLVPTTLVLWLTGKD